MLLELLGFSVLTSNPEDHLSIRGPHGVTTSDSSSIRLTRCAVTCALELIHGHAREDVHSPHHPVSRQQAHLDYN